MIQTEVLGITRTTAQESVQESVRDSEATPNLHVQIPTEDSPPPASSMITPPSYEFLNSFSSSRSKNIVYSNEDEEFDEGDFLNMSADKGNPETNDDEDERRFEEEMANFEDN